MDRLWWERVPNALAIVTDIKNTLLSGTSIELWYSQLLPWRQTFVGTIKETVKQYDSDKLLDRIIEASDPGDFLLNKYCKQEKRLQYRPAIGHAKFFAENDDIVLHRRYLWVTAHTVDELKQWRKFVSEYLMERGNKEHAVFIIENPGICSQTAIKSIKNYSLTDYVNEFDRIVFSTIAASGIKEPPAIKNYLITLTSIVPGNDIELSAKCINRYQEFLKDPYDTVSKVVQKEIRSDGSDFVFNKTKGDVQRDIWAAQIKVIYPLLEEYRERFVFCHREAISYNLPITNSSGEVYTSPEEVELGTLHYIASCGGLHLSTKEYDELTFYKDARNKLSHLNRLNLEDIRVLCNS